MKKNLVSDPYHIWPSNDIVYTTLLNLTFFNLKEKEKRKGKREKKREREREKERERERTPPLPASAAH